MTGSSSWVKNSVKTRTAIPSHCIIVLCRKEFSYVDMHLSSQILSFKCICPLKNRKAQCPRKSPAASRLGAPELLEATPALLVLLKRQQKCHHHTPRTRFVLHVGTEGGKQKKRRRHWAVVLGGHRRQVAGSRQVIRCRGKNQISMAVQM